MKLTGQAITMNDQGVALGQVTEVKMSIYHDGGGADHVLVEHDLDLNEVRVIVNEEAVWSTLERSQEDG
jgi:hypothetical protein